MAPSTPTSQSRSSSARKKRWASPVSGASTPHHQRDSMALGGVSGDASSNQKPCAVWVDQSRKTSLDSTTYNLLSLPSELLHTIASELCGSKAILSFALVNKRISRITQQALMKKLVVPKNRIKKCLEVLVHHPDLIEKVGSVDIGDYDCIHRIDSHYLGMPNFDPEVLKFLGKTIATNTGGEVSWRDFRQRKGTPGTVSRTTRGYFLNILLSLCPNLKSITLELPETTSFDLGHPSSQANLVSLQLPAPNDKLLPTPIFQGAVLRVMQKKLESLTIVEDSRWKGPAKLEVLTTHQDIAWRNMGKHTITLAGFARLKCLDMPMEVLGRPNNVLFLDPTKTVVVTDKRIAFEESSKTNKKAASFQDGLQDKVLPLTLKHMYLRSCNHHTFSLLQKINKVPSDQLQLQNIHLFFKTCPRVSIGRCYSAYEGQSDYLHILSELSEKNIRVAFYTGANNVPFDMQEELRAFSLLSHQESWRFALLGKQFTDLNTKASTRRCSSANGRRLFIKHIHHYFLLLNRPTFDAEAWASVGFFHGIQNTKWDHGILPPKLKVSTLEQELWSKRVLGKQEVRRRLPSLPDLYHFAFSFQNIQSNIAICPAPLNIQTSSTTTSRPESSPARVKGVVKRMRVMGKFEEKIAKQGHRIGRRMSRHKEESLERSLVDLTLGSNFESDPHVCGMCSDTISKFDDKIWAKISWRACLQPTDGRLNTSRGSGDALC
ncbi:hypothetical protein BKA66DRAFT_495742 [Pyrenochaeta sp. MPI-SDFR-AT-0127]|nr:hypothetical protein BKA66DRAFT_495742 [Pyrenochaeta sp. MPI-SDFR-AT-0127]